ncbi:MAG TPA: TraX family protein [Steroidobacteraceae bacterium]|nr:TraX family protein [Steroidobacteraceae bacterium]
MSGEAPYVHRGIEAAKWLGLVLMLGDHVNLYLLDSRYPVLYLLGRLVFPLFALALGFGLAGRGSLVLRDTIRRLFVWACIAQIPWAFFTHAPLLNVVFTLACGAVLYEAVFVRGWSFGRALLVVAAFLAGCAAEFGVAGLFVVFAALWFAERCNAGQWVVLVLAVVLLHAVNASFFAVLALPVFWVLYCHAEIPRIRHFFYPAYAGQFVLLAFLRYWL